MSPLVLILLRAGVNIAGAHASNESGGEILSTTSFILDAAQALDILYEKEAGQPLDWTTIKHHKPLAPAGMPAEEFVKTADPENIPLNPAEDPDLPDES